MVERRDLRIVFFGTPAFALTSLNALLNSRHAVAGVVTQPDRPRGRGQQTSDSPVKARAVEAGLPILQPTRLRDAEFATALEGLRADLGVVAAYGRILPESTLAVPPMGMINVHASLLPRYRGAAPVHRAVMEGESHTGVTIMRVVKALDAGAMIMTASRPIGPDETSADVERALADLGASLLLDAIEHLVAGTAREVPQDEAQATYAPPLRKEEGLLDWGRPSAALHNQIRGLHPWPLAFCFVHGRRVIVRKSALVDGPANGEAGSVALVTREELAINTGTGRLRLVELQPEGKRPMSAQEFLAGYRLAVGDRLTAS